MLGGVSTHLDLSNPAAQTIGVVLQWTPRQSVQTISLPVWTPGSYTVRDPSQHLHSLSAVQGERTLLLERRSPERWQFSCEPGEPLCIRYRLEARQLTVRTNHLDPEFASLSLPAVVMLVEGERWNEHRLQISVPEHWSVAVPLGQDGSGSVFVAEDFDHLVDAPVHAGSFDPEPLCVRGQTHSLILLGSPPCGWPSGFKHDLEAVCTAVCDLVQSDPSADQEYQLVIQTLEQGYGGLEHDNASVMQFPWPTLQEPGGYRKLLQLVGHEYLHQWNVRRLRPSEFIPYRYDRPVVSDGLWFAEGVTSYFDLALPLLAGLSSRLDLLKDLGADLSHVLLNPGVAIQSLADSSREAWVRLYKQTPANAHSQISYYRLGTALAFCLDVHLRQSQHSLAEVLRCLWKRFGVHGRGYRRSDLLACFSEYSKDLETLLPDWLDGRSALPIEASLQRIGLSLNPVRDKTPSAGWLIRERQGRVWIDRTDVDGPAQRGGLVAGDEVVALRDWRCHSVQRCSELLQGDSNLKVTYSRRGVLKTTDLLLQDPGVDRHELAWDPGATQAERALRDQWFGFL